MYEPSISGVTDDGSSLGDEPAAQHDVERVGHADELLEVGGDQQDGQAGGPGIAQLLPDRRLGADVDAAGGMGGDEHAGVAAHLAADDQLLLVAAGEGEGGGVAAGRADVVARR